VGVYPILGTAIKEVSGQRDPCNNEFKHRELLAGFGAVETRLAFTEEQIDDIEAKILVKLDALPATVSPQIFTDEVKKQLATDIRRDLLTDGALVREVARLLIADPDFVKRVREAPAAPANRR